MTTEEYIKQVDAKQDELIRLLYIKAEKLANKRLASTKHTQLSYLTENEREFTKTVPREVLIDYFIVQLNKI